MSILDWSILIVAVIALRLVSVSTRKHMKGVADFLSASRLAGRYLLTYVTQMGGWGVISFVALWQVYSTAGLPPIWWGLMIIPTTAVLTLSGWIYYRFRETRALTLAQFLEMRYDRHFRIFAGFLMWGSGILNFAIFPAVTARFFVYFCGLPQNIHIPGIPIPIPTVAVVMAIDLAIAVTMVTIGGQISVLVTECVQGMFSGFVFIIVAIALLFMFRWEDIIQVLRMSPQNASMIHPFHTSDVKDFNLWFYLIGIYSAFYNTLSWQGTQGFNTSARSPHEQKMGLIIGIWRDIPRALMILLLPLGALVVLKLPQFAAQAEPITQVLAAIENEAVRSEMQIPVALGHILPIGIKGLLATCMLFFSFTCHDSYMHSWGSIFIQDVYIPITGKTPGTPEQHVRLLRFSVIGVAIFAFLFSLFYIPTEKVLMFFAITGAIWMGGAGAVIIGGLYWKRGTTAGAYAALVTGASLGIGRIIAPYIYKHHYGKEFPINGQVVLFIAMVSSALVYVIVSLVTSIRRERYNLDRLLKRGVFALHAHRIADNPQERITWWMRLTGITREFSRSDRVLAMALVVWNLGWSLAFVVITVLSLTLGTSYAFWSEFWKLYIWLFLGISVPVIVWFTIGGITDLKALYRDLSVLERDHADNGFVSAESKENSPAVSYESIPPMAPEDSADSGVR